MSRLLVLEHQITQILQRKLFSLPGISSASHEPPWLSIDEETVAHCGKSDRAYLVSMLNLILFDIPLRVEGKYVKNVPPSLFNKDECVAKGF